MNYLKLFEEYNNKSFNENQEVDDILNVKFWEWFNNSEIINNGYPIKLYHGSDKKLTSFKFNINSGIYSNYSSFTNNKKLAESYGSIIYEVYLKMNNPYIIDGRGDYIWNIIDKKNSPDLFFDEIPSYYDGIIFKNVIDFNGRLGSKYILDVSDIYMVRKNTQIKSIQNDGTWDISDSNIYS